MGDDFKEVYFVYCMKLIKETKNKYNNIACTVFNEELRCDLLKF